MEDDEDCDLLSSVQAGDAIMLNTYSVRCSYHGY